MSCDVCSPDRISRPVTKIEIPVHRYKPFARVDSLIRGRIKSRWRTWWWWSPRSPWTSPKTDVLDRRSASTTSHGLPFLFRSDRAHPNDNTFHTYVYFFSIFLHTFYERDVRFAHVTSRHVTAKREPNGLRALPFVPRVPLAGPVETVFHEWYCSNGTRNRVTRATGMETVSAVNIDCPVRGSTHREHAFEPNVDNTMTIIFSSF